MQKEILILGAVAALTGIALAVMRNRSQAQADGGDYVEPTQETGIFEDVTVAFTPSTYMTGNTDMDTQNANLRAFLDMIAYSEGTGQNYNVMFGWPRIAGRTFASYADHPRQYFSFTDKAGRELKTSAAGRYQFLVRTWDDCKKKLGLQDFGPESQDAAALELIRQRGAINDIKAGRTVQAIQKCAPIWASLPGAGYDQPERPLNNLLTAYSNAGGTTAEA